MGESTGRMRADSSLDNSAGAWRGIALRSVIVVLSDHEFFAEPTRPGPSGIWRDEIGFYPMGRAPSLN
jgi:hypothetical protein